MNSIHSRYRNEAGHVVLWPTTGEIFDTCGELLLDEDGVKIAVTHELLARTADYGGVTIGLLTDGITYYNRRFHPEDSTFNEEFNMLHGGEY